MVAEHPIEFSKLSVTLSSLALEIMESAQPYIHVEKFNSQTSQHRKINEVGTD
jgi:hypothetical protein